MSVGRTAIGLVLLALGALFLLEQTGNVDAGTIIGDWWPLVIVLVGALQWTTNPRAPLGPAIIIGVGLVLLVGQLGVVPGGVANFLWPLVLIAIGGSILLNRSGLGIRSASNGAAIDRFVAFGGMELVDQSPHFRGGSLNAVFGGITLDLRQAQLAPEGANLGAFAAFGGVTILVPKGWRVNLSGLPIFGGLDNKTLQNGQLPEDAPTLNIQATVLFGGVDVKY